MNATYNITGKLATILALVNTILEFGDPEHYAKVVHFRNKVKKNQSQLIQSKHKRDSCLSGTEDSIQ